MGKSKREGTRNGWMHLGCQLGRTPIWRCVRVLFKIFYIKFSPSPLSFSLSPLSSSSSLSNPIILQPGHKVDSRIHCCPCNWSKSKTWTSRIKYDQSMDQLVFSVKYDRPLIFFYLLFNPLNPMTEHPTRSPPGWWPWIWCKVWQYLSTTFSRLPTSNVDVDIYSYIENILRPALWRKH